jgi:hypothetical protein
MSKIEKLLERFKSNSTDFTWDELVKVLNHFGYHEKSSKGKTGGSRTKFINDQKDIISLHKPHPSNIVKKYVSKQIIEKLGL